MIQLIFACAYLLLSLSQWVRLVCVQKQCGSCDWNDGSFVVIFSFAEMYLRGVRTHAPRRKNSSKKNEQTMNE